MGNQLGSNRAARLGLLAGLALAVGAGFVALPSGPARAGEPLAGTRHRDGSYKFSFRYFQDWKPVPVQPGEENCLAQYLQQGASDRDPARIGAYRFARPGTDGPVTTGDKPAPPRPRMGGGSGPLSMFDMFNEELDDYQFKDKLSAPSAKVIASKDKVPGRMWELEARHPYGRYYMVFAIFKKAGQEVEYGLWLRCEGTQRKKWESGFEQVVKSFQWFDDKAEEAKGLDALDGLPISKEKRRVIEKGLVKDWGLVVSPKKNYVILYNRMGRRNDLLARLIAERIEKIREQIYEVQFPPARPVTTVSLVRVCGNKAEYHQYGGPGGSAGYWSDQSEELVFYDASPRKAPDDDTFAVLYHEAFHQYIYYSIGEVAPHSWFNEGHGDYYAGAKYSTGSKKFKIEPFNWRVGVVRNAIGVGPCSSADATTKDGKPFRKWDRSKGGYTPLEALVAFSQGEYYSYPSVSYAQGWSLVYFLREIVPKNPKWKEKWGKILDVYFETLKAEVNKATPPAPKKPEVPPPGMGDGPGAPPKPEGPAMGDVPPPPTVDPIPTDPGMADPAMGDAPPPPTVDPVPTDPGMADPAMGDPGMSDPSTPEPGMDEGGMGEPGMGDEPAPGMGDDPEPPPDNPEDTMGIPQFTSRFMSGDAALKAALEKAFQGIDWAEFEEAWRLSIKKVNG